MFSIVVFGYAFRQAVDFAFQTNIAYSVTLLFFSLAIFKKHLFFSPSLWHIVYSMEFTNRFSDANATLNCYCCLTSYFMNCSSAFCCCFPYIDVCVCVCVVIDILERRYSSILFRFRFTLNFLHYHINICLLWFSSGEFGTEIQTFGDKFYYILSIKIHTSYAIARNIIWTFEQTLFMMHNLTSLFILYNKYMDKMIVNQSTYIYLRIIIILIWST